MKRSHRKNRGRRGYLLLTVVVMIAVASLMLSRLATTSMRVASMSVQEERDLRSRWAVISLRRFALNNAKSLLGTQLRAGGEDSTAAEPAMWKNVSLAGKSWRVVVSDESAKLSLVHFARTRGKDATRNLLEDLYIDKSELSVATVLNRDTLSKVKRWEHWFDHGTDRPSFLAERYAVATQRVTLWGDGRLNILRCETETLDALWHQLFGHGIPPVLNELRAQSPPPTKNQVIRSLALRESQATLADSWLKTDSNSFSVWIFCQSDRRVAASLYVEWGPDRASAEHRGYEY